MPKQRPRTLLLSLLVGLLALFGLAACGDDEPSESEAAGPETTAGEEGDELTPVDVQLSWLPTAGFAGEYVADDSGYFEDEGLDVTLVPGGPNVQSVPTVLTGKALLTWSTPDTVIPAIKEGAGIKIIGAVMQ